MKLLVATVLNKTCLMEQFYPHCSGTAIFKLKVTLKFPLAKPTLNDML